MKSSVMLMLLLWACTSAATSATSYGSREHVRILGDNPIEVTARLDAGAPHAILKVKNLKYVLHGNGTWVHFVIDSGDVVTLQQATLDQPVLHDREVHMRDGGIRHEPVVALDICVGTQRLSVPFTLLIRQSYTPPMILGSVQIAQLGKVDAQASFLHEPDCSEDTPPAATVSH